MDNNIYQPPSSDVSVNETYKGSPVKAVLIASSVDVIGTIIFSVIFSIAYGVILATNGASAEQIDSQLSNIDTYSIPSLLAMTVGFSISVYAGYLCAKIVNHNEYRVTSVFAVIIIAFSLLFGSSSMSFIENAVLSVLNLLCIFSGAWIHIKKKHNN